MNLVHKILVCCLSLHTVRVSAFVGPSTVRQRTFVKSFSIELSSLRCSTQLSMSNACIHDAVSAVRSKQTSATQLVHECLSSIANTDDRIQAFLSVQGGSALTQARDIDERVRSSDQDALALPLLGIPIAIKDNLCTKGIPTTAASRILEGYIPSYDATAVRKLKEAGAIIIGKVNMDEFAMGSTTETSAYQVTRNPRNLAHAPGGSSGGSAACVASGAVLAALGTDTGGSVRQPAAWCGVVGLKPTYGRISRSGLIAYASSLDTIGTLTRCVSDSALILSSIAGHDRGPGGDPTALHDSVPDYMNSIHEIGTKGSKPLTGVRIGVIAETLSSSVCGVTTEVSACVNAAIDVLQGLGASVGEVSLPKLPQQCAAYYVNALAEASANLARFDGIRYGLRSTPGTSGAAETMLKTRHDGFGDEVKQRILLGTFSLSSGYADQHYNRAMAIRAGLRDDFRRAFEKYDLLVCPTAPTPAYMLGEALQKGVSAYADDVFTAPASLAGLPAISIPCGIVYNKEDKNSKGLPIGLQIIAPPLQESSLLAAAYAYEQATLWGEKLPPGIA